MKKDSWMPIMSAILPWIGGIIAPPKIIITRKPDPWVWYLPRPAKESEKIHGHIIEQNSPALKKEYIAVIPLVDKPTKIHIAPRVLNIPSVKAGLSLVR